MREITFEEYKNQGKRGNKYGNKRVASNGITFDSQKEMRRWHELQLLERVGVISELKRQVKYILIPTQRDKDGKLLEQEMSYIADFTYMEKGKLIVEDVKSAPTRQRADYIIKRKLMLWVHDIRIREA